MSKTVAVQVPLECKEEAENYIRFLSSKKQQKKLIIVFIAKSFMIKVSLDQKSCPYCVIKDGRPICKKNGKLCCHINCPYEQEDQEDDYSR